MSHKPCAIRVRALNQLAPRSIAWLWPGRLAFGKLAILDGDPGLGKSLLALDLCARLSNGRPLPDGAPSPGPINSLILNSEDGPDDTLLPRLRSFGADLARVFITDRDDLSGGALALPSQLPLLEEALRQSQARLLVIDPIMDFLDHGVQCMSDQSVRRLLGPLAQLARRYECTVLLIRHLNKLLRSRSLYRGSGSIAFLAACRSAWLVAREPREPDRCVLAQLKNNLAPPQPSLVYQLVRQPEGPPVLTWLGPSDLSADQLLKDYGGAPLAKPRDRARDFLYAILDEGPRTVQEIWDAAQKQGLSKRTLDRAKADLKVRSGRKVVEGQQITYWLLPSQELPAGGAEEESLSLERWFAPLRERYPSPTPLDEE